MCLSQIRLRQALAKQGVPTNVLPWKIRSQWIAWCGLAGNVFFVFFQGWTSFAPWDLETFFMNYIVVIIFLVLAIAWKFYHKTRFVRSGMADLITHRRDILAVNGVEQQNGGSSAVEKSG